MRLATLNIGGPAVERAARILGYLLELDADVLVLTETRPTDGTRLLLHALRDQRYEVVASLGMAAGERGVALASRGGLALTIETALSPEFRHRLVAATIPSAEALTVVGAYVPSRDASEVKIARKKRFLSQVASLASGWGQGRLVFIGDLNIVGRAHVPKFSAFRAWEYDAFEALRSHGLVDAYGELYPGVQAHKLDRKVGGRATAMTTRSFRVPSSQRWSTASTTTDPETLPSQTMPQLF